jgi:hypothetical protein
MRHLECSDWSDAASKTLADWLFLVRGLIFFVAHEA